MSIRSLSKDIKSKILFTDENNIYTFKFTCGIYFIIKTSLINNCEMILSQWSCSEYEFEHINISIYNDVILVVSQEKNELIIRKINKNKQVLKFEKRYLITGNEIDASTTLCINENNIIVFLIETKTCSYNGFLCDLSEYKSYFINDRRIIDTYKKQFKSYEAGNNKYICFGEEYMEDWEKEEVFDASKKGDILIKDCFESINIIKVNDLISAIKSNKLTIPFKTIDIVSLSGYIRYIGMNNTHIYYRIKDFNTQIEKVYSVSKINLKKKLIMQIKHDKKY